MVEKFLWLQNHFLENIFPPKLFIKGPVRATLGGPRGSLVVACDVYFGWTLCPTICGMGGPLYLVTEDQFVWHEKATFGGPLRVKFAGLKGPL